MKHQKYIVGLLLSSAVLFTFSFSDTTHAENSTVTVDIAEGGDTDAGQPFDPAGVAGEGPGTVTPDIGSGKTSDSLRIQYVTGIDFGVQKLSLKHNIYKAKVVKFTPDGADASKAYFTSNFLQIADLRGTHEGWNVKVSVSDFKLEGGSTTDLLYGAELRVANFTEGYATGNVKDTKLPQNDAGKSYKAITKTPSTIYSADKDKGMALHTLIFGDASKIEGATANTTHEGIQLYVPATSKAKAGKYKADLTWTLSSGPL